MDLLLMLRESTCLIICLLTGIFTFNRLNRSLKCLLLLAVVYFVTIACSYVITEIQDAAGIAMNNQWIFNLYMIVETGILFYVASYTLKKWMNLSLLWLTLVPFLLVIFIHFFKSSFLVFANFGYIMEGIMIVILYSAWLYRLFHNQDAPVYRLPEVWMCLGLILYFACAVPYLSLINVIEKNFPDLNIYFFDYIIDMLANTRYLFLALAFFISARYRSTYPSFK